MRSNSRVGRLSPQGAKNSCAYGAAAEHLVIADLLRNGYEPFRAASPGAPCDLLVLTPEKKVLRFEVKASYKGITSGKADRSRFDVVAVVLDTGIAYWSVDRKPSGRTRLKPFHLINLLTLVS